MFTEWQESYAKTGYHEASDNSKGKKWGIAALVVGCVAIAAFMVARKRRKNKEAYDEDVPEDVYVEHEASTSPGDRNAVVHQSNARDGKSTKSRSSFAQSIRSKFSRKSKDANDPMLEDDHWNDEYGGGYGGGGVAM